MTATTSNILSRIEREYISFLYDNARRTTNQTVTVSQIEEFIHTPEGRKGLESFKVMCNKPRHEKKPMRVGAFL